MRLIALLLALLVGSAATAEITSVTYRQLRWRAAPELDVHAPAGAQDAPVLIYVHGGAWQAGSHSRVNLMARHFNGQGMIFVSVGYGLVPEVRVEDQAADIDAAIGWVAANIGRYGGDGANLHLIGHSAGAHLVALAATAPGPHTRALLSQGHLRSVIANDTRAYDIAIVHQTVTPRSWERAYRPVFGDDPARWARLSPKPQIGAARLPAFLVISSGKGGPGSRAEISDDFAAALRARGATAIRFDGARYSHAAVNRTLGARNDLTATVDAFLAPLIR